MLREERNSGGQTGFSHRFEAGLLVCLFRSSLYGSEVRDSEMAPEGRVPRSHQSPNPSSVLTICDLQPYSRLLKLSLFICKTEILPLKEATGRVGGGA